MFQVRTQLQEWTLSNIPKILMATFLLIAIGIW
ncbi:flagellar biosynthetic protein FliQ [Sphingomonas immobilis]